MRQILLFTTSLLLTTTFANAQDSDTYEGDYEPIRASLESWDPIRGAWLADAMPAVVNQETVPVRTFPENITPMEMLALVPEQTRDEIATTAQNNQNAGTDANFWSGMNNMVTSVGCTPRRGRSYGDPHLVSFDGERFSFQTVGEFVLAKNSNGRMEVQTRQKPVQADFSLNTAVAMNVNGDRVGLYAEDRPDNFMNTPLRVNGQPVEVTGGHYFLPNGGVVRRSGNNYIVNWPTGESVDVRSGRSGGMNFYNVSVNIRGCSSNYSGVLGNADGIGRNDFDGSAWSTPRTIFAGNNNTNWERERSAFVTRNFAEQHRVTMTNSLFDYGFGQSTITFTDRSYPRVIRTIDDLDPVRRQRAQRACNDAGIRGADLNGCIYDNAYLNITPVPEPPIREPIVTPETVTPIREPIVNTNPEPPIVPIGGIGSPRTPGGNGDAGGDIRPDNTAPVEGIDTPRTPVPRTPETTTPKPEETAPVRDVQTEQPRKRRFTWGTPSTSTPRESTPTRTTPTESTPTRTTPTRSTPTRTTPTRSTPTRTTPTRSTPTRTTPTRSTPTRSTPTRSTPTRSTPTRSTPTRGGGRGGR